MTHVCDAHSVGKPDYAVRVDCEVNVFLLREKLEVIAGLVDTYGLKVDIGGFQPLVLVFLLMEDMLLHGDAQCGAVIHHSALHICAEAVVSADIFDIHIVAVKTEVIETSAPSVTLEHYAGHEPSVERVEARHCIFGKRHDHVFSCRISGAFHITLA